MPSQTHMDREGERAGGGGGVGGGRVRGDMKDTKMYIQNSRNIHVYLTTEDAQMTYCVDLLQKEIVNIHQDAKIIWPGESILTTVHK